VGASFLDHKQTYRVFVAQKWPGGGWIRQWRMPGWFPRCPGGYHHAMRGSASPDLGGFCYRI